MSVGELLDDHVALDIECRDRLYLKGYVPNLQTAGQVVSFRTGHLGIADPVAGGHGGDGNQVPPVGEAVRGR